MNQSHWWFVAMEYYALILNRTFLLTISGDRLHGKVCHGITSIDSGPVQSLMAVHGDLNDPKAYVKNDLLTKPNHADFSLPLASIISVEYTQKKKWGMGYYPHDGRVFVETATGKREFIVLGNQSGQQIASRLAADAKREKQEG